MNKCLLEDGAIILTRFWGGKDRGIRYQLSIYSEYTVLTRSELEHLIDSLRIALVKDCVLAEAP